MANHTVQLTYDNESYINCKLVCSDGENFCSECSSIQSDFDMLGAEVLQTEIGPVVLATVPVDLKIYDEEYWVVIKNPEQYIEKEDSNN